MSIYFDSPHNKSYDQITFQFLEGTCHRNGHIQATLQEIIAKAKLEGKKVDVNSIAFTLGFLAGTAVSVDLHVPRTTGYPVTAHK